MGSGGPTIRFAHGGPARFFNGAAMRLGGGPANVHSSLFARASV